MTQELIHQVFAEMGRRDSNWNGHGRSRETAVRLAVECCAALTSAPKEPVAELPGMWERADLEGGETDCVAPAKEQAEPMADARALGERIKAKAWNMDQGWPGLVGLVDELVDIATQPERIGLCGGDAVEAINRAINDFDMWLYEPPSRITTESIDGRAYRFDAYRKWEPLYKMFRAHLSRMAGTDAWAVSGEAQRLGEQIKARAEGVVHAYSGFYPGADEDSRALHAAIDRLVALAKHTATAGEPKP